jgi:hypothetical protein
MLQVRKGVVVAIMAGSMASGALGAWLFAPVSGGAATTSTSPSSGGGGFHSNESPAHEKGESAQREAEENSGHFRCHGGSFHSNEDPAHEKGESAQHEGEENSGQSPTP